MEYSSGLRTTARPLKTSKRYSGVLSEIFCTCQLLMNLVLKHYHYTDVMLCSLEPLGRLGRYIGNRPEIVNLLCWRPYPAHSIDFQRMSDGIFYWALYKRKAVKRHLKDIQENLMYMLRNFFCTCQ